MSLRPMLLAALAALSFGCASAPTRAPDPDTRGGAAPLPPIPEVDGPLSLSVAYPPEGATIAVDSNFIFGATGSGRAQLTINGTPIEVKPNGGWLAFIPVPRDGVYRLQATKDGQTASFERTVKVPAATGSGSAAARITSVTPSGGIAVWEGENVRVSFTGTPNGRGYLVLPSGRRIPLVETSAAVNAANNAADFQVNAPARTNTVSRYSGILPARALRTADTAVAVPRVGTVPEPLQRDTFMERCAAAAAVGRLEQAPRCSTTSPAALERYGASTGAARVELIVGRDNVRAPLAVNLGTLSMARVGTVVDRAAGGPHADFRVRGRPSLGGPFHYFWPHGTLLTITGEQAGYYRVQLTGDRHAWVPAGDVQLLPEGAAPPGGVISSGRFRPEAGYIDLRLPLPARLPYHVEETEFGLQLDVFGAASQVNFFQYGKLDPLIERAVWSQPRDSLFRVNIELNKPVWGYDAFHDAGGALVLRIRRPPEINPDRPLQGLLIAVDPGHGGRDSTTRGPTSFPEARANLAIALQLQPLLEAAGARVLMTRTTDVFIPLGERPKMATDSNAHVLVSVHNNAFPDGVNPFLNNGTSTYYYHPQSVDLAQAFQRELLAELGLNDIGYGRADLALVRPTWMPAALTEASFMMIPEQEAALKNEDWQRRIARAHLRGIEAFLRKRAAASRPGAVR